MKELVAMWGAGGLALEMAEALAANPDFQLAAVCVESEWAQATRPRLKPLHAGGWEVCASLRDRGIHRFVVAIGNNLARLAVGRRLMDEGFELLTLIHPAASLSPSAVVGPGCLVLSGAVVGAGVQLGMLNIVNNLAFVGHESRLADGVHVAPNAAIAGGVQIGEAVWFGIGAVTIEGITIGDRTVVGAGAVVVRDLPSNVVAYGVPARVRRSC